MESKIKHYKTPSFSKQRYKNICIVKMRPLTTRVLLSAHKTPMT